MDAYGDRFLVQIEQLIQRLQKERGYWCRLLGCNGNRLGPQIALQLLSSVYRPLSQLSCAVPNCLNTQSHIVVQEPSDLCTVSFRQ